MPAAPAAGGCLALLGALSALAAPGMAPPAGDWACSNALDGELFVFYAVAAEAEGNALGQRRGRGSGGAGPCLGLPPARTIVRCLPGC